MILLDFFNECLDVYGMFVEFLFTYSLSGIPVGFIILACLVFSAIVFYILGSVA